MYNKPFFELCILYVVLFHFVGGEEGRDGGWEIFLFFSECANQIDDCDILCMVLNVKPFR